MKIPTSFTDTIISIYGEGGKSWVKELPERINRCKQYWNLTQIIPVENLSYNFVAFARQKNREVVLKIGLPDEPEFYTEVEALKVFNGHHCVTLIDCYMQDYALLLERLQPGFMLTDFDVNDETLTILAAQLINKLPIPEPSHHPFPTVKKWTAVFERLQGKHLLPSMLLEQAISLAEKLWDSTESLYLLHGDLHHENIILDEEQGWLAIDPKGVIGDKAFEAARFLHNPYPDFINYKQPLNITKQRVQIISESLKVDPQRILSWSFIDCILSASWSIEEGMDASFAIKCAQIQAQLLK